METVKKFGFVLLLVALGFICGYVLGLHDNGTTADDVRKQLDSAKDNQSGITKGIGQAASEVKGAGKLIDECLYIISRVQQQPAGKAKKN